MFTLLRFLKGAQMNDRGANQPSYHRGSHFFLVGALGAAIPFLLRAALDLLAPLLAGGEGAILSWPKNHIAGCVVGLAIIALIGGVIAYLYRDEKAKLSRSLALGLAAPGLVLGIFTDFAGKASNIGTGHEPSNAEIREGSNAASFPLPALVAAEPVSHLPPPTGGSQDTLLVRVDGCNSAEGRSIRLIGRIPVPSAPHPPAATGGQVPSSVSFAVDCQTPIRLPDLYTRVQISVDGWTSKPLDLPAHRGGAVIGLSVRKPGFASGILRVMGRRLDPLTVEIRLVDVGQLEQ